MRAFDRLMDWLWPRRYGEVRAPAASLVGLLLLLVGLFLVWVALNQEEKDFWTFGFFILLFVLPGLWMPANYFGTRMLFGESSVDIYKLGRKKRTLSYGDIEQAELGPLGAPLRLRLKSGKTQGVPTQDQTNTDGWAEALWLLDAAGVPVPHATARLNRLKFEALKGPDDPKSPPAKSGAPTGIPLGQ